MSDSTPASELEDAQLRAAIDARLRGVAEYLRPQPDELADLVHRVAVAIRDDVGDPDMRFERAWITAWYGWRRDHRMRIAVRFAMSLMCDDSLPRMTVAESLRADLERDLQGLERRVALAEAATPSEVVDGMHALDAAAVMLLKEIGDEAEALTWIRDGARRRWSASRAPGGAPADAPWRADPSFAARMLAVVLLESRVLPRFELLRATPASIPVVVARDLTRICSSTTRTVTSTPGAWLLTDGGAELASIPAVSGDDLDRVQRSIEQLGSLTAHRLVRWLVTRAHGQAVLGLPDATIIEVEGGVQELARLIGAGSNRAQVEVLAILRTGQSLRRTWPGGEEGGLWTFSRQERSARGVRARVEIRLGAMLLPHAAIRYLRRGEQSLVPVLPIPPVVGRPRDYAAQAAFQSLLVQTLSARREELVVRGGAYLSPDVLQRLATDVGLPRTIVPAVIDRWTQDGDDAPACLAIVEPHVYHLPDNPVYGAARAFLNESGRRTIEGRQRAQDGGRRRRRRLFGGDG